MPLSGQLSLDDERPLEADIEFVGSDLIVSTPSGPMGRWPLELCLIQPDKGGFLITIDHETAWFVPDDPVRMTRLVLEHWGAPDLATAVNAVRAATRLESGGLDSGQFDSGGPHPVASDNRSVRAAVEFDRGLGSSISRKLARLDKPTKWQMTGLAAGLVAIVAIASAISEPGPAAFASANLAGAATIPGDPAVFQGGVDEVALRWNDAAGALGTEAFMLEVTTANRLQAQLTGDLILYGSEDPATDTVHSLMISAGPAKGDEATAVLAVWGNLIAIVNPELAPDGRRAILERLGVALDRPLTIGLDSETTEGGARYWLQSGVLGSRVLLGVQPIR